MGSWLKRCDPLGLLGNEDKGGMTGRRRPSGLDLGNGGTTDAKSVPLLRKSKEKKMVNVLFK